MEIANPPPGAIDILSDVLEFTFLLVIRYACGLVR